MTIPTNANAAIHRYAHDLDAVATITSSLACWFAARGTRGRVTRAQNSGQPVSAICLSVTIVKVRSVCLYLYGSQYVLLSITLTICLDDCGRNFPTMTGCNDTVQGS